jgi:glycosyltransferase involved in cell wall biosynthesis
LACTKISVVICTRNPRRDYLRRVLEALCRQTLPTPAWELVVVDNGSSAALVQEVDLRWHPLARHVREDRVGLINARLRGLSEARGEWVVFVDDDNVLAEDYLDQAAALAGRHPGLGVLGAGRLEAEFEAPPPIWLHSRLQMIGVRSVEAPVCARDPATHANLPFGAGLIVPRPVAAAYSALVARLGVLDVVGRSGDRLYSGDDDLFAWAAAKLGLGFGLFPDLRLTHLIRADRLKPSHLVRLVHDHAFSHSVLRHLLSGAAPRRGGLLGYARLAGHALRHGRFSMQCRWAELRGERSAEDFIRGRRLRPIGDAATWTVQEGGA